MTNETPNPTPAQTVELVALLVRQGITVEDADGHVSIGRGELAGKPLYMVNCSTEFKHLRQINIAAAYFVDWAGYAEAAKAAVLAVEQKWVKLLESEITAKRYSRILRLYGELSGCKIKEEKRV